MNLFSSRIELISSLEKGEIGNLLRKNVQPPRNFGDRYLNQQKNLPFEGELGWDVFTIKRCIQYRNSFLPKIKGSLETHQAKTKIILQFSLHPFVLIFILFWLTMVGAFMILALNMMDWDNPEYAMILIPTVMFFAGLAMPFFGFGYEKNKAVQLLKDILKARIFEP